MSPCFSSACQRCSSRSTAAVFPPGNNSSKTGSRPWLSSTSILSRRKSLSSSMGVAGGLVKGPPSGGSFGVWGFAWRGRQKPPRRGMSGVWEFGEKTVKKEAFSLGRFGELVGVGNVGNDVSYGEFESRLDILFGLVSITPMVAVCGRAGVLEGTAETPTMPCFSIRESCRRNRFIYLSGFNTDNGFIAF